MRESGEQPKLSSVCLFKHFWEVISSMSYDNPLSSVNFKGITAYYTGHRPLMLFHPLFYILKMNSMKLVILLYSLYWSIHTKDESKRGTAFAFIFGVN